MRIKGQLLVNAMQDLQLMPVGAVEKTIWRDGAPSDEKELQVLCYVYNPGELEPQEVRVSLKNTPENKKIIMDNIGQLIGTIDSFVGLDVENCTTYSGKMQTDYVKIVAEGIEK